MNEDLAARRTLQPHRGREWIGAREAQTILGISRSACLKLAQAGKLPGRFIDEKGARRHYEFRYADVRRLKDSGEALKAAPRPTRIRVAWIRFFGPIPEGFTVISRDRSHDNIAADNLALIPTGRAARRVRDRLRRRRRARGKTIWTLEMKAVLLRDFATRNTDEMADEFGCTALAVRCQARRMGLRKSAEYLSDTARHARALPLGTERLMTHEKNNGIIMVKVSNTGKQSDQWRPKTHLLYEQVTGKKVPRGWNVFFKDGNKNNWSKENVDTAPKNIQAAVALAHFNVAPSPLRKVHRIRKQLQREIRRQSAGEIATQNAARRAGGGRKGRNVVNWTPAMLRALEKGYPTKPFKQLAAEIGVTEIAVKSMASKLGIRRELGTILADISARRTA